MVDHIAASVTKIFRLVDVFFLGFVSWYTERLLLETISSYTGDMPTLYASVISLIHLMFFINWAAHIYFPLQKKLNVIAVYDDLLRATVDSGIDLILEVIPKRFAPLTLRLRDEAFAPTWQWIKERLGLDKKPLTVERVLQIAGTQLGNHLPTAGGPLSWIVPPIWRTYNLPADPILGRFVKQWREQVLSVLTTLESYNTPTTRMALKAGKNVIDPKSGTFHHWFVSQMIYMFGLPPRTGWYTNLANKAARSTKFWYFVMAVKILFQRLNDEKLPPETWKPDRVIGGRRVQTGEVSSPSKTAHHQTRVTLSILWIKSALGLSHEEMVQALKEASMDEPVPQVVRAPSPASKVSEVSVFKHSSTSPKAATTTNSSICQEQRTVEEALAEAMSDDDEEKDPNNLSMK